VISRSGVAGTFNIMGITDDAVTLSFFIIPHIFYKHGISGASITVIRVLEMTGPGVFQRN